MMIYNDLPMQNGLIPVRCVRLPEGTIVAMHFLGMHSSYRRSRTVVKYIWLHGGFHSHGAYPKMVG